MNASGSRAKFVELTIHSEREREKKKLLNQHDSGTGSGVLNCKILTTFYAL